MKIYLARHGEAVAKDVDALSPLSAKGNSDIEKMARFLSTQNIHVACIFHSSKLRAKQTANILSSAIKSDSIEERSNLDPLDLVSPIASEIILANQDMLYVGHMPFMGKLIGRLIASDEANDIVAFQPGTLVCLTRTSNSDWSIAWTLNPELFV